MPKFRKKPIVVEASQWFKEGDHPDVEKDNSYNIPVYFIKTKYAQIDGLCPGEVPGEIIQAGDWIVADAAGDFCLVKPSIFDKIYEPC